MNREHAQLCRKHGIEPSHAASDAAALGELVNALMRELGEMTAKRDLAVSTLDLAQKHKRDLQEALAEQCKYTKELLREREEAAKQEPVGWVREWEGDESDLGHLLFVQNSEDRDDSPNWFRVFPEPINLPALIAQSKAEERERCAEFCEMYMAEWGGETIHLIPVTNRTHYGSAYAAAIRALQD